MDRPYRPRGRQLSLGLDNRPNPLRERLGDQFFKDLPDQPGIYRFLDSNDALLYVGKAKDLRNRVTSYTRIRGDRDPGRLVRMVRNTARITIQACATEEDALVAELDAIRTENPVYNRAGRHTRHYAFIDLLTTDKQPGRVLIHLRLFEGNRTPDEWLNGLKPPWRSARWETFGAFKGIRRTQAGFMGLARLLWAIHNDLRSPLDWPPILRRDRRPDRGIILDLDGTAAGSTATSQQRALRRLLRGTARSFIDQISNQVNSNARLRSMSGIFRQELDAVELFYERGPLRLRRAIRKLDLDDQPLPRNNVDQALIRAAFR